MLPEWPNGTVAILTTVDQGPHAIPVSAVVRAGDARIVLGLGARRGSLSRLRVRPRVAVALIAPELAVTAHGRAEVLVQPPAEGVVAVLVRVDEVRDHLRPTFAIESGVGWRWTDEAAQARDAEVRAGLLRLVAELP